MLEKWKKIDPDSAKKVLNKSNTRASNIELSLHILSTKCLSVVLSVTVKKHVYIKPLEFSTAVFQEKQELYKLEFHKLK